MKKNIIAILSVCGILLLNSCADMFETDSSRQLFDAQLDSKTDSIFFAMGVMQSMQQLADQQVFIGEMRGDLVNTTTYTDNNLRKLANFSAGVSDKYDSAYVYYRVINNCNYYIAHRDTTLFTGSTAVAMNEYAAIKAFRAWAYLQLARVYGKVPFFTEPLMSISQINKNTYPEYNLQQIVSALAPDMEQYTGFAVPKYPAPSSTKTIYPQLCFIPVDVILGEMYLEVGEYANAARHYVKYITSVAQNTDPLSRYANAYQSPMVLPSNFAQSITDDAGHVDGTDWSGIFSNGSNKDIISYIPMAVNKLQGKTTNVPLAFGYNYYATSKVADSLYIDAIQIEPSRSLTLLSDSTDYYYFQQVMGGLPEQYVTSKKLGDMRLPASIRKGVGADSTKLWITKYNSANIILYRMSTVYLHLAEAFNRLNHPDAAFTILKEGLNAATLDSTKTYITNETRDLLRNTFPLLSEENIVKFPAPTAGVTTGTNFGIHQHGAGVTSDANFPGRSGYQFASEVGKKMREIAAKYNVNVGTTKADSVNAMEDILCDEYALEFAFEGTRWFDLMRLARHKDAAGLYGPDFGNVWLANKLQYKNPVVDLRNEQNWYMPFK